MKSWDHNIFTDLEHVEKEVNFEILKILFVVHIIDPVLAKIANNVRFYFLMLFVGCFVNKIDASFPINQGSPKREEKLMKLFKKTNI